MKPRIRIHYRGGIMKRLPTQTINSMKRRSFLQSICAGIAALFVPSAVKALESAPTGFRPYHETYLRAWNQRSQAGRAIFSGDICVWDGDAYRPAVIGDVSDTDLNNPRLRTAIAVPNGNGGFDFARYPECMNVTMDIEIRGERA